MPDWAILLVPPLLLLAIVLNRGVLDRHHGHHQAAAPARHFPGARARRGHDLDAARTLAWISRVEQHHDISPAAAAQIQAHVCGVLATRIQAMPTRPAAWEPVPANTGPLPAAMADVDDGTAYPDWSTGQFAAVIDEVSR